MLYSLEDLEKSLGRNVLAKGRMLVGAEGLDKPLVQRGGELVTAVIRGFGRDPVRVYVRVREKPQGVRIEGECSCSQRRNCLHVAAVLLTALEWEQPGIGSMPGPEHSGESLKEPQATLPSAHPAGLPRLVYWLAPTPDGKPGVRVETFAVRGEAGGRYAEARSYLPGWALRGVPPRFLNHEDLAILRDLAGRAPGGQATSSLHDASSVVRILETGRCHLADLSGPLLRPGAARAGCLGWRMDEDGSQTAEWVSDAGVSVIALEDLWYVDVRSGECGPLNTGLPAGLVQELEALSPLAPERSAEAREDLKRVYPDEDFPLPSPLEVESLAQVKPVPHLLLDTRQAQAAEQSGAGSVHIACLSFEYHGRTFGRADSLSGVEGDQVFRVRRDEAQEQADLDRLQGLGFVPDRKWSRETGKDCFVLSPERGDWLDFQMRVVPALRESGWLVEVAEGFGVRLAQARDWRAELNPAVDAPVGSIWPSA